MITRDEVMRGQACPAEYEENLEKLLLALNKFRAVYGKPMIVTSGYRSTAHNSKVGGKARSAHLSCQAADFADRDGGLANFCLENIGLLESCGLWMEDPRYTSGWIHLQSRPASKRVFIP